MKAAPLLLLLIIYNLMPHCLSDESSYHHPLIIVPGLGGSRAYLQSPSQIKPHLVWVNPFFIIFTSLMTKYLELCYNRTSHTTYNPRGFNYVTKGWGDTYTIEYLSNIPLLASTDYKIMIKEILRTKYYKRNSTVRAAPYDFRKAPNEMGPFFEKLKHLVEDTFHKTENRKVVIMGHSLGCLYSLSFLKQMTFAWKTRHLKAFLCVSGPLAGAVKTLLMESIGNSFIKFKSPTVFREFERTFPSTLFLLPQPKYFGNQILIQTPEKKYTSKMYEDLFKDMDIKDGYLVYQDVKDLVDGSESPSGVDEVYCFHGAHVQTVESFTLKNFNDTHPIFKYGDGDGTVNSVSLQICQHWKDVKYKAIKGATHKEILHNRDFLKLLIQILSNK